jgi:hypothetical protein
MILGFSTLFIAICISIVAAYYSILGLTAIFAAAFWPVVIMGTALEAGKIMTTVWLHKNWQRAQIQYKLYLLPAVFMLMFLTSMGIFGFLSKAHIDQTSGSQESVAQVQRITTEIGRQKGIIERAEDRLKKLETVGTGVDANVQGQINTEQQRIDGALTRIKPAIDEQNQIIASQTKLYSDQIARIDEQLSTLQRYIDSNEVAKAQSMVGAASDGNWGTGTANAVRNWQAARNRDRTSLVSKLETLENNNPSISAARKEISRLRADADTQINESNKLINRLREQLGKTSSEDATKSLDEQQNIIKAANTEIDALTQKKYTLEAEYRKLEAEVGPVKYIAEFIYDGNTDKNLLEKAVRWVIILIVAVFDPLALVLILAGAKQIEWAMIDRRRRQPNVSQPIEEKSEEKKTETNFLYVRPVAEDYTITESVVNTQVTTEHTEPIVVNKTKVKRDIKKRRERKNKEEQIINEVSSLIAEETLTETESTPPAPELTARELQRIREAAPGEGRGAMYSTPIVPDNTPALGKASSTGFGNEYPSNPQKGDLFLRVDSLPNRLFKYNGNKWIEVDKNQTDVYAYEEQYIKYLVEQIDAGTHDPESLTDVEREQIQQYLRKNVQ